MLSSCNMEEIASWHLLSISDGFFQSPVRTLLRLHFQIRTIEEQCRGSLQTSSGGYPEVKIERNNCSVCQSGRNVRQTIKEMLKISSCPSQPALVPAPNSLDSHILARAPNTAILIVVVLGPLFSITHHINAVSALSPV